MRLYTRRAMTHRQFPSDSSFCLQRFFLKRCEKNISTMTNRKVRGKNSESWRKNVPQQKWERDLVKSLCLHDRCVDDAFTESFPIPTNPHSFHYFITSTKNSPEMLHKTKKNKSLMLKRTAAIKNTP